MLERYPKKPMVGWMFLMHHQTCTHVSNARDIPRWICPVSKDACSKRMTNNIIQGANYSQHIISSALIASPTRRCQSSLLIWYSLSLQSVGAAGLAKLVSTMPYLLYPWYSLSPQSVGCWCWLGQTCQHNAISSLPIWHFLSSQSVGYWLGQTCQHIPYLLSYLWYSLSPQV